MLSDRLVMKMTPYSSTQKGAALVVVLLFVVLLTVLALAFFMKATAFRSLSQSAVNDFKTDSLARSAISLTLGDLRSEISGGSTLVNYGTSRLYLPKSGTNMVPMRSGNPTLNAIGEDPIPNLIRRSVRTDSIAAPGVSSRASAASSATPSKNRRYVSASRWNKHYLIPRDSAVFGGTNSTKAGTDPVTEFATPDWVYVTNKGPEVIASGTRTVIGRYAFAIYNEGGLLDVNSSGYPSNTPVRADDPNDAIGTVWGFGNKGALAAADLTAIGLTQKEVDQLIGWRAFASTQPAGSFPNLNFDTAAALRFHDGMRPHPEDFLEVASATYGGRSDQAFTSRQQLINFRNQIGFTPDALQYLGTFSRSLEQPSFIPNPNRPRVQSAADNNKATYGTGNDAFGVDRDSDPAKDINPPILRVRVKTPFTRPDGTAAAVGDPLLVKRFPLSRLVSILRTATASKSQSDPIYRDFGIYRSSASAPWKYDHGDPTGILRLDAVASAEREPDFFELLKAGINVGSLAKGSALSSANWSWQNAASYPYLQHFGHDTLVNLQLLQIGANIIDQYDEDGYPTRIQFEGDSDKEVRGIEDLAYLYRLRLRPAKGIQPTDPSVTQKGALFLTPEVWNPHAVPQVATGDRPNRFRIRAESVTPSMPTTFLIPHDAPGLEDTVQIDWGNASPVIFENSGTFFREPTLLTEKNVPTGALTSGGEFPEFSSGKTLVGLLGTTFEWLSNGKGPRDGLLGRSDLSHGPIKVLLEYHDGSSWIEYDRQFYEFVGPTNSSGTPPVGGLKLPLAGDLSDIHKKGNFNWSGARTDPRTSRWGLPISEFFYLIPPLDLANHTYPSHWPDTALPPFGHHFGNPTDSGFTNPVSGYTNNENSPYQARHNGFASGYWSQNTVRLQKGFFGKADPFQAFYARDPDGIARRAIGGYSSDTSSGGSNDNLVGLPMATGNGQSRPRILNRPFRSVAELGYTFRGTPWRNIDFSFPESGDAALLDLFCLDEVKNEKGLVAGKLNLNTRQAPVLRAMIAGSIAEDNIAVPTGLSLAEAEKIAAEVVAWTSSTANDKGPMQNRSELIGRWNGVGSSPSTPSDANPDNNYKGVSLRVGTVAGIAGTANAFVPALREAWVRALGDAGDTRVWNLMIDAVAQSGKFASDGAGLDDFLVEGEKRYWLHVAIDRLTGEVLDSQLELVIE